MLHVINISLYAIRMKKNLERYSPEIIIMCVVKYYYVLL